MQVVIGGTSRIRRAHCQVCEAGTIGQRLVLNRFGAWGGILRHDRLPLRKRRGLSKPGWARVRSGACISKVDVNNACNASKCLAMDTAHGTMDQVLGPDTVWTADGLRHRAIQIARVRLPYDMPQDADLGLRVARAVPSLMDTCSTGGGRPRHR
jgi:hypothetical protein